MHVITTPTETVSTHESATYGSADSRTCIQCCARTFGLYHTPDLDPTSPRHIACLVPGLVLCALRQSSYGLPVLAIVGNRTHGFGI